MVINLKLIVADHTWSSSKKLVHQLLKLKLFINCYNICSVDIILPWQSISMIIRIYFVLHVYSISLDYLLSCISRTIYLPRSRLSLASVLHGS